MMTENRQFTFEVYGQPIKRSCLHHINTIIKALQIAVGNSAVSIDRQDLLHAVNFANDLKNSIRIVEEGA